MSKALLAVFLLFQLIVFLFVIYVTVITIKYINDTQTYCYIPKESDKRSVLDPIRAKLIKDHSIATIVLISFTSLIVLITLLNIFIKVPFYKEAQQTETSIVKLLNKTL